MEITINVRKENPELDRIEYSGTVSFEGVTPSNADFAEALAKKASSKVENIVVKQIMTKFSSQSATFSAVIYGSSAAKTKYEMSTKHLRAAAEKAAKEAVDKSKADAEAKAKAAEEAKAAKEAEAAASAEKAVEAAAPEEKKEEAPKAEEKPAEAPAAETAPATEAKSE